MRGEAGYGRRFRTLEGKLKSSAPKPDWASKKVDGIRGEISGEIHPDDIARLLRREHKKDIAAIHKLAYAKQATDKAGPSQRGYLHALQDVLHKLKEGRP